MELVPTPYDCFVRRYDLDPWVKALVAHGKGEVAKLVGTGMIQAEAEVKVLKQMDTASTARLLAALPVPVGVTVDTPALIERALAEERSKTDNSQHH